MKRMALACLLLVVLTAAGAEYDIAVLLAERKAYLVDASKADALESDRELTRAWRGIPNRWLEDIAADVRARRTETNPTADQRAYGGTWRIAQVAILRGSDGDGQLLQVLRYGLATTLAVDEPRMGEHSGDPGAGGFRFKQVWPYIDPNEVDTLITNLVTITNVTNPYADSQVYSGTFVASEIGSRRLEDAAIEVWRWLTRVSTPANAAALAALPYRTIQKNEILRLFSLETGEGDMFGLIWDYLNPSDANRTNLFAIADATLVSTFASGWTYSDRDWKIQKDNTATFTLIFKQATWLNVSGTTNLLQTNVYSYANYAPGSGATGLTVRIVDGADGVPTASATAVRDATVARSGYVLDSVAISDNRDGSISTRREMTRLRGAGEYFTVNWEAAYGTKEERETVTWFWLSASTADAIYNDAKSNSAAMVSAFWRPAPAGHRLDEVHNDPMENGARRVQRVTYIPQSGASAWPENTATYTNMFWDFHYKSYGSQLYVSSNRVCRWEKYEATVDAAHNDIQGWRSVSMFGDSTGRWMDDGGTRVLSWGHDRYKAVGTWIGPASQYVEVP